MLRLHRRRPCPGRRRHAAVVAALAAAMLASGCSRPRGLFVEENARAHVEMLAGTIGSRPAGTPANARARAYIVDQLRLYGFDVRVQETDARRPDIGRTARVANIIATLQGERREAMGLLSHYDSRADTPGAGDDAFGVAVSLEAARSLASRGNRRWTLFVLVTDAEEHGLMGAAALMTDRDVTDRLRAYVNVEAAGASSPVVLFETGPGNGWLTRAWARHAPHPRGGSYSLEVYRRLPNDTDFSILKRHDIPGLNFAAVGDSHAYHTARDVSDRLSRKAIRETGENVVSVLAAVDALDITRRSSGDPTYFDVAGRRAVSYGAAAGIAAAAAAIVLGVVAFVKVTSTAVAAGGVLRWMLALLWAAAALVAAPLAMVGATWALRASREVYHPWYAYPDRLFALLAVVGISVAWAITRLGAWLPARAHPPRHPALTWSVTLPLWIALAAAAQWLAPAAAHLWVLPLLAAGVLVTAVPSGSVMALRIVSLVVFLVTATLWLRETLDLARFMVAVLGRLPIVTPVFVYAAILALAGAMLAPPFIAAAARSQPLVRPKLVTGICLVAIAVAAGLAYAAPAYTYDHSLRRYVRAIQDGDRAIWEVGSTEPGLDLEAGAPGGWTLQRDAPAASVQLPRIGMPFVFRASGPALGPPPAELSSLSLIPLAGGVEAALTVVPGEPGLTIRFAAPPGVTPARSNLPGVVQGGRWTATYVAPPADGVAWRASFASNDAAAVPSIRVLVTSPGVPGGGGWQRLPPWLPQERTVWTAAATWILTPAPTADR